VVLIKGPALVAGVVEASKESRTPLEVTEPSELVTTQRKRSPAMAGAGLFTVKVEVTERVLAAARKAIAEAKADDWRTPYRAAAFCIENGVNLEEAATWVEKSITIKPGYYNLLSKAKLLAAKGKKAEAIDLAKKAIELGLAADPKADVVPAQKLMEDWK